jgi:hypothetical protein
LLAKPLQQMEVIPAWDFIFSSKVKEFQFSEVWPWYQLF